MLDSSGCLKISDFAFSTLVGDADEDGAAARTEQIRVTATGTPNYVAPEVFGAGRYDGKMADVWSVGVIVYVLLAGKQLQFHQPVQTSSHITVCSSGYLPFEENTLSALIQKICRADFNYPKSFSLEVRELIGRLLVLDPHSRLTLR